MIISPVTGQCRPAREKSDPMQPPGMGFIIVSEDNTTPSFVFFFFFFFFFFLCVLSFIRIALPPADQKKVQALAKDPSVLAEVQRDVDAGTAGASARPPP